MLGLVSQGEWTALEACYLSVEVLIPGADPCAESLELCEVLPELSMQPGLCLQGMLTHRNEAVAVLPTSHFYTILLRWSYRMTLPGPTSLELCLTRPGYTGKKAFVCWFGLVSLGEWTALEA